MELSDMLALVGSRQPFGDGIELASFYVASLGPCLADKPCQDEFFQADDQAHWAHEFKSAKSRFVYHDPSMMVESGLLTVEPTPTHPGGLRQIYEARPFVKSSDLKETLDKSCMDFTAVFTSKRKDRDADVLDTKGAEIDQKMPLLWMHVQKQPIGRMLQLLTHTDDRATAHYGIIDNKLGNDVALLIDYGAVRISHGFIPLEFEPLSKEHTEKSKDVDPRMGWFVKRFKVVETSTVTVPSNEDATITAFSRNKLKSAIVKSYAENLRLLLPKIVTSGWQQPIMRTLSEPAQHKCSCGSGKAPVDDGTYSTVPAGFRNVHEFLEATEEVEIRDS